MGSFKVFPEYSVVEIQKRFLEGKSGNFWIHLSLWFLYVKTGKRGGGGAGGSDAIVRSRFSFGIFPMHLSPMCG